LRKSLPKDYHAFQLSQKKDKRSVFIVEAEKFMDKIHQEVEEDLRRETEEDKHEQRVWMMRDLEMA